MLKWLLILSWFFSHIIYPTSSAYIRILRQINSLMSVHSRLPFCVLDLLIGKQIYLLKSFIGRYLYLNAMIIETNSHLHTEAEKMPRAQTKKDKLSNKTIVSVSECIWKYSCSAGMFWRKTIKHWSPLVIENSNACQLWNGTVICA